MSYWKGDPAAQNGAGPSSNLQNTPAEPTHVDARHPHEARPRWTCHLGLARRCHTDPSTSSSRMAAIPHACALASLAEGRRAPSGSSQSDSPVPEQGQ
jgi:hypothetical protein